MNYLKIQFITATLGNFEDRVWYHGMSKLPCVTIYGAVRLNILEPFS